MTLHNERSLYNIMEQEKINPSNPTNFKRQDQPKIDPEHIISPARPSHSTVPMYSLKATPSSPNSPWTLSPLQTPSPTLLYHCIASLHRQEGTVNCIAATSTTVYTGSDSSRIRAWRQPDCSERGYIKASSGHIRAILAYANLVITSHGDNKVRIWNITCSDNFKAKKVTTLPKRNTPLFLNFSKKHGHQQQKHKDCVSCMAYYHAEGLLYTGSWDKTVKAWRVSDSFCVDSFYAHQDNVNAIMVNQDDGVVFTCSSDGSVKIWRRVYEQNSHTLTMTLKFQASPINVIALTKSSTSCFLYSGSSDGYINFWEKERGSGRFNHGGFLQGHRFSVLCLVGIEKLLFSGSEDTTIRVWRREEGNYFHECLAVVDAHRGPVKCLAVSLEMDRSVLGFLVYSGGLDQSFKVWRVKVVGDDHENNINNNRSNISDMNLKFREFEVSPVLSPSWVERKLQAQGNN